MCGLNFKAIRFDHWPRDTHWETDAYLALGAEQDAVLNLVRRPAQKPSLRRQRQPQ